MGSEEQPPFGVVGADSHEYSEKCHEKEDKECFFESALTTCHRGSSRDCHALLATLHTATRAWQRQASRGLQAQRNAIISMGMGTGPVRVRARTRVVRSIGMASVQGLVLMSNRINGGSPQTQKMQLYLERKIVLIMNSVLG